MTKEQQYFLQVLTEHLHSVKSDLPQELDWDVLSSYAVSHQLSSILYYQCKACLKSVHNSANPLTTLQSSCAQQISNFANRKRVIIRLKEALTDISYIFVKGATIADLYPIPALRSMGDVDVIVHEDDIETVKSLLCEAGFSLIKESLAFDERHYSKNGINIEIHTGLVREDQGNDKCKAFFDTVWDYIDDGQSLDWNFHFLYLIAHLRGHFASHGVGFRQFLDIAIVTQKIDLDWNWITEKAEEIGLLKFLRTVVSLNQKWFDINCTLAYSEQCTEFTDIFFEQATEEIFANGVFGDASAQNIPKQLIVNGNKDIISRFRYLLKQAFPPYRSMLKLPYCGYVKTTKLLMPIAWLHRGIYRLTDKKRRENFMARTVSSKEEISRLENWGLI